MPESLIFCPDEFLFRPIRLELFLNKKYCFSEEIALTKQISAQLGEATCLPAPMPSTLMLSLEKFKLYLKGAYP